MGVTQLTSSLYSLKDEPGKVSSRQKCFQTEGSAKPEIRDQGKGTDPSLEDKRTKIDVSTSPKSPLLLPQKVKYFNNNLWGSIWKLQVSALSLCQRSTNKLYPVPRGRSLSQKFTWTSKEHKILPRFSSYEVRGWVSGNTLQWASCHSQEVCEQTKKSENRRKVNSSRDGAANSEFIQWALAQALEPAGTPDKFP